MRGGGTARAGVAAVLALGLTACGSSPETPPWGGSSPTPEQVGAGWTVDGEDPGGGAPQEQDPAPAPTGPAPRFVPCRTGAADRGSTHLRPVREVTRALARSVPGEDIPEGTVTLLHAGDLVLTDGRLGAGNGYEAATGGGIGEPVRVAPGRVVAPVTLAVIDGPQTGRRVAFAEVRVGEGTPVSWAFSPDLSIVTDGGDGGFFPAGLPLVDGDDSWIDGYVNAFEAGTRDGTEGVCVQRLPASGTTVESVLFSTGYGDGQYPTYLGRDATGAVVSVVHTGLVLPWGFSGLPGPKPANLDF